MADNPPYNPGTMTPQSKSALGGRLDLETPPDPLAGAAVVPDGDLSDVGSALADVNSSLGAAYSEHDGYQSEARDIILMSPQGSTASEGYHLHQQDAPLNHLGHMDVGPIPDRPVEERA